MGHPAVMVVVATAAVVLVIVWGVWWVLFGEAFDERPVLSPPQPWPLPPGVTLRWPSAENAETKRVTFRPVFRPPFFDQDEATPVGSSWVCDPEYLLDIGDR